MLLLRCRAVPCYLMVQCDACDLALDVFKQMYEDRIKPNVVTYNTLVDVYGKTGQWEKAVQVLDDMRKEVGTPLLLGENTRQAAGFMAQWQGVTLAWGMRHFAKKGSCGTQHLGTNSYSNACNELQCPSQQPNAAVAWLQSCPGWGLWQQSCPEMY